MADALRTTYWVPQMGSKFARSACGTKRSARAAARCETAGVAKDPAAERAPAATADFRNALRSMTGPRVLALRASFVPKYGLCHSKQARRTTVRAGGRRPQHWLFFMFIGVVGPIKRGHGSPSF